MMCGNTPVLLLGYGTSDTGHHAAGEYTSVSRYPPAAAAISAPEPSASSGASVQCSLPLGVWGKYLRRRSTSAGNPPVASTTPRLARMMHPPSGVPTITPATRPSSLTSKCWASVFTRISTPTFSADWINRPIRAVPLTSRILRWWVAISQTFGMTREAEYAQLFGDSCEADRIFCKSGPAMMPMPKNEVGQYWLLSFLSADLDSLRALMGLAPTERLPVPAPGSSP